MDRVYGPFKVILTAPSDGVKACVKVTIVDTLPANLNGHDFDLIAEARTHSMAAALTEAGAVFDRSLWRVAVYDMPPSANSDGSGQAWPATRQPMVESLFMASLGVGAEPR